MAGATTPINPREIAISQIVGLKDFYHPKNVLYEEKFVRDAVNCIDPIRDLVSSELGVSLGEPVIKAGNNGSVWLDWEGETGKGDYWFMVNIKPTGGIDNMGRFFRGGETMHPKLTMTRE